MDKLVDKAIEEHCSRDIEAVSKSSEAIHLFLKRSRTGPKRTSKIWSYSESHDQPCCRRNHRCSSSCCNGSEKLERNRHFLISYIASDESFKPRSCQWKHTTAQLWINEATKCPTGLVLRCGRDKRTCENENGKVTRDTVEIPDFWRFQPREHPQICTTLWNKGQQQWVPRSRWAVTFSFFYEETSRLEHTYASVQFLLKSSRRRSEIILSISELSAQNIRIWGHSGQGWHSQYELQIAWLSMHSQIRAGPSEKCLTLWSRPRKIQRQGSICWRTETVDPTEHLKLLG